MPKMSDSDWSVLMPHGVPARYGTHPSAMNSKPGSTIQIASAVDLLEHAAEMSCAPVRICVGRSAASFKHNHWTRGVHDCDACAPNMHRVSHFVMVPVPVSVISGKDALAGNMHGLICTMVHQ